MDTLVNYSTDVEKVDDEDDHELSFVTAQEEQVEPVADEIVDADADESVKVDNSFTERDIETKTLPADVIEIETKNDNRPVSIDTATTTMATSRASSQRLRKPTQQYNPMSYQKNKAQTPTETADNVTKGRGMRLDELPATKAAIAAASAQEKDLVHQLLFAQTRTIHAKSLVVKNNLPDILEFSGYLPLKEGHDAEKLAALEEEMEAKYSTKAYMLRVSEIKVICDALAINRRGRHDKDSLIACLLNFLGVPSEDALIAIESNSSSTANSPATKKRKRDRKNTAGDDDEESPNENAATCKLPSDLELRQWVRAFIHCYNMDKLTLKAAITIASDKFGVDMTQTKERMKAMLVEEF
ncbi:hypothetical protein MPSEU_000634400 [Mayamaea pseudoterrestris]|nr:hypothetical protein MPSEU_000634400 [Mayamaea pseudoterrestris]